MILPPASPDLFDALLADPGPYVYAAEPVRNRSAGESTGFQFYYANPAFLTRFSLTDAELQARTIRSLLPELAQTDLLTGYQRVVDTGQSFIGRPV